MLRLLQARLEQVRRLQGGGRDDAYRKPREEVDGCQVTLAGQSVDKRRGSSLAVRHIPDGGEILLEGPAFVAISAGCQNYRSGPDIVSTRIEQRTEQRRSGMDAPWHYPHSWWFRG